MDTPRHAESVLLWHTLPSFGRFGRRFLTRRTQGIVATKILRQDEHWRVLAGPVDFASVLTGGYASRNVLCNDSDSVCVTFDYSCPRETTICPRFLLTGGLKFGCLEMIGYTKLFADIVT